MSEREQLLHFSSKRNHAKWRSQWYVNIYYFKRNEIFFLASSFPSIHKKLSGEQSNLVSRDTTNSISCITRLSWSGLKSAPKKNSLTRRQQHFNSKETWQREARPRREREKKDGKIEPEKYFKINLKILIYTFPSAGSFELLLALSFCFTSFTRPVAATHTRGVSCSSEEILNKFFISVSPQRVEWKNIRFHFNFTHSLSPYCCLASTRG